jgi:pimeloyl-ACP methyl ester carboxylesterase
LKSQISIDGRKINYSLINIEQYGNSSLLVFLHDGLGSIRQWGSFPEKISNEMKMPALIYDRFGHGDSDDFAFKKDKNFFNKESECLNELLDALKITSKLILIGSSDGGTISLVFGAVHPAKVKGIITIAAHTFVENKTVEGVKNLIAKYIKNIFRKALEKYHSGKTEKLFRSELWISGEFGDWNIYNTLIKIKCPVLAVQGEKDEYGTEKQLDSILSNVKTDCNIKLINGAGHFPYLEKENEMINLIKEFVVNKIS